MPDYISTGRAYYPMTKPAISSSPVRRSNSVLGIVLMLSAMFSFAVGDAIAKILTTDFHPVQIIWFRQIGLFIGVCVIIAGRGLSVLRTNRPALQMSRGALVIVSSVLFVYAIRHVPLADAVAASFVAPFFVTIFGAWILGEDVGVRRWSAVIVGFIGALIIIRPGMGVIHPTVLLVVIAAGFFAARQVMGRLLADKDKTITTVAYTAITASIVVSVPLPFVWVTPTFGVIWIYLFVLAFSGAFGEILIIKSLEVAEAAAVAPFHYTIIIWGTLYGYLIFQELPDQWTLVGTVIIVAAGLYTLRRGRLK